MKLDASDIRGVVGIVPTPANPDAASWAATDTVNLAETEKMVRLVTGAGIEIIMTNGTFGEAATGLTAKNWSELCRSHLSNSVSDEEAIIYLATVLTEGKANPEATEELAHRRVLFSEAVAMVKRGEITDSMSVMAIMHYAYALVSDRNLANAT